MNALLDGHFLFFTFHLSLFIFQQFIDDLVGGDVFGFGIVVAYDAMAQDIEGDGADILGVGGVFAVHSGIGAGTHNEVLGGSGTGAPGDIAIE